MTVITIYKIEDTGYSVIIKDKICKIKNQKSGKTIRRIPQSTNRLYWVNHLITIATVQDQINILMPHCRLGHISADAIHTLTWANAVTGLHLIDPNATFTCNLCDHAKTTHKVIHKISEVSPAQSFGNKIHTNIWGPAPISTIRGHNIMSLLLIIIPVTPGWSFCIAKIKLSKPTRHLHHGHRCSTRSRSNTLDLTMVVNTLVTISQIF